MSAFHVASEAEVRAGETTDIYFRRTEEVLRAHGLADRRAYAEVTTGSLPERWPWGALCGLDEALRLLEGRDVDVDALPEGTLFPARDRNGVRLPVLSVDGPYGAYCVYETPLLGLLCQATGVAACAARIAFAAAGSPVLSFGIRRMHPALAPMLDRAAWVGGVDGVSCILSARRLGIEPRGTMPHALVILFGDQAAAFRAYDADLPPEAPRIALVDTYCDEKAEAILAAETLGERLHGVRLDTPASRRGSFEEIIREVRWELDLRGFRHVRIYVSGSLDEHNIPSLRRAGADGFGVGTHLANAPVVDFALDVLELEGKPAAKRGKFGGKKEVFRCPRCLSFLCLPRGEPAPVCPDCGDATMEPQLQRFLEGGRLVRPLPEADDSRRRVREQLPRVSLEAAGGEEVSRMPASDRERAIEKAKELYEQRKAEGMDFSQGPCLADEIIPDWCVDVAHSPRQAVDNEPQNQCRSYREGRVCHFVELDPEGNVLRAR
ncbi:MAG: nicotinate phosphoribosyltransferase [Armatimonadetes bacterium]|nr:nicotinate phosphoribosyltransferase [Armatimonadota bacterium]